MVDANESRRQELVARLTTSRTTLERCLSDVTPEIGYRGSEWSVGDLLSHVSESFYQDLARRILGDDGTQLQDYNYEAEWVRGVEKALASVDDTLGIVQKLTPDQMDRVGMMNGDTVSVLDAITLCASHFEEHVAQLKDEVRPREGLPNI